jgi:hypothetical protein
MIGEAIRYAGSAASLIRREVVSSAASLAVVALLCDAASAQELTPRAYWPTPNGTNVFVLAYQRTTGDIVTDPSLPLTDVDSDIDYLQLSYQRTFSLSDRTATVQLSLPFSEGETKGVLEEEFRRRETSGMGDARLRFAINLKGAPSMDSAGFKALRANPVTVVGASLLIQAPTGEYESDKVINIGTNRWSVKPAIGVIWPLRPTWLLEFEVGAWFFQDNDDFLGETRKQDPILSTEFHLIKRIRPGFWASLDANFYVGGQTSIGEDTQANLQRNSRLGVTMVFPLRAGHALRGSFSTGAVTESGGDYEMFNISYLYVW